MRKNNIFIGIDNGVTGSIGIIETINNLIYSAFIKMPVLRCLSYTKEIQHIQRIDWENLTNNLPSDALVLIERPMVNPRAFKATQSALRALEATIISLEICNLNYEFIDSKTWQKEFISSAIMGHNDMKKASMEIGLKLFPSNGNFIKKHGDADGLLIAEYARRKFNREIHS